MKVRPIYMPLVWLALCQASAAQEIAPATAPATRPNEIRRGIVMGDSPEQRGRRFYENVIRRVEPSLKGDPSRLPQYLELFEGEFVEDRRTFALDISADWRTDGVVAVTGHLEFEEHRRSLAEFFKHLGFTADVSGIAVYPLESLGEERFAILRAERAFIYDKPAAPRETLTESLKGDGLFLLSAAEEGHYRCHAADGYVGFVAAAAIERLRGEQFDTEMNPPRAAQSDERIEGAIAAATKLLGTRYVWGGMTSAGIDCSGLIHAAYRSQGIRLPRDADQQALVGKLVATRWHRSSLRRGDVLFFLGRRGTIHHTALYLGNNRFLEATDPGVAINSFDPAASNYVKKRDDSFCFAKRIFDQ